MALDLLAERTLSVVLLRRGSRERQGARRRGFFSVEGAERVESLAREGQGAVLCAVPGCPRATREVRRGACWNGGLEGVNYLDNRWSGGVWSLKRGGVLALKALDLVWNLPGFDLFFTPLAN